MTPFETPESQTLDPNCIFCKIISGEVPSRRIYSDDRAIAFLDIGAWHRGHALVVPKRHVPDMINGAGAFAEIAPAVEAVARLLVDRMGCPLQVRWQGRRFSIFMSMSSRDMPMSLAWVGW